jgi:DNA invertase Pin-like site-specific DNA recombinase
VTEALLKRRCAVYTRKSTDEGLDMAFNSLDAQREACEAYVASQRGEGWVLVADRYDDGGYSGGTLERPGLKRLLADIQAGKVDCIVVYKIDRLTRSLMDFSKLVDLFEKRGVTFVSVTQSFNTTSSMGRLTLNVLLSFAQFEREVGSERVRDKIAASKRRGLWTGGVVPLGYKAENKQLVIEPAEAAVVQRIFQRFVTLRSITKVLRELDADGVRQRSGRPFDKVVLHKILRNRTYRGLTVHKKDAFPGKHQPIIDENLWNEAQSINREPPRTRARAAAAREVALLRGLIFGPDGWAMTPQHARKKGRCYRYYVSTVTIKRGENDGPIRRVPAGPVDQAVIEQIRRLVRAPEIVARTIRSAELPAATVQEALADFDRIWDELFPAEQARLVRLLVERVDVSEDGIRVRLKTEGLRDVVRDLQAPTTLERAA